MLEQLLLDLGEPIIAFDLDDRVILANHAAEDLLGRAHGELLGLTQSEAFGEEISNQVRRESAARRCGLSTTYEVVGRDRQGQEQTLLVAGSPLHDDSGEIIGSCGALRDISIRKRREREIELRMQLILAIAESMRALLTLNDFDQALQDSMGTIGRILGAHSGALFQRGSSGVFKPSHDWQEEGRAREAVRLHGLELDEAKFTWLMQQLREQRVLHIASPAVVPDEAIHERMALNNLGLNSMLAMQIEIEGRCQGFLAFANPRSNHRNNPQNLLLLGMLADVFASAINRRAADLERGLLITAVEQSEASIMIADADGILLYVNPAFERVSGYSRREALGQNPRMLSSGLHDSEFYGDMWLTLGAGMVWCGDLTNRRKDGTLVHVSTTISPIAGPSGDVVRYVAVSRDLTRERHLETQLRQSQTLEAVGRLAAGVAHEINTPTQYIGDNLTFVRESLKDLLPLAAQAVKSMGQSEEEIQARAQAMDLDYLVEEIPRALEQSRDGLDRVTRIVSAMKEFSHPGSHGRMPGDINRMVRSTVTVAGSEWKHVASIHEDLDESLPIISCYVAELNQAILNMLINAAHAIGATGAGQGDRLKGEIRIRTRREEAFVLIEIEDTGGGIPKDVLPHIFAPFFTTKEVGKGSGQGLAVVRSVVVDKHGGRIDVDTQEGIGSTFRLWIPLLEPEEARAESEETGHHERT